MENIKLYTCDSGHQFLLTKECPFCCAINHQEPSNNSKEFMRIYTILKDKSKQEIDNYYHNYIPWEEPEKPLNDFSNTFK